MSFEEAVRIVGKAMEDPSSLTFAEAMSVNEACSILAIEYIKVRDRIGPA